MNARQKRFVGYYLDTCNATKAAKAAGYSPRSAYNQGWRLLQIPEIRQLVDAGLKAHLERIDAEREAEYRRRCRGASWLR